MINEHSLSSPVFPPFFFVFLIKFPSFSMSGRFFEAFPDLPGSRKNNVNVTGQTLKVTGKKILCDAHLQHINFNPLRS